MKHIFRHWEELSSKRKGYSEADITFSFDTVDDVGNEYYGRKRKTLQAAINDAKRYFKTHRDWYYSIYAHATLREFYQDDTQAYKTVYDCARLGSLTLDGEYFDLCESVDWLKKA